MSANEKILRQALLELLTVTAPLRMSAPVRAAHNRVRATLEGTEPAWIENTGESDACPVPAGSDCETESRDGMRERNCNPEGLRWHPHRFDNQSIARYRVWES